MKKKIFLIIFILALIIVGLIIPNETYTKLFKPINNEKEVVDTCLMYLQNEDKQLVGVNVDLTEEIEDVIYKKWDLLTTEVPENFTSPVCYSTTIIDYSVSDNILSLNISEDCLNEQSRPFLECLIYNFCNDEVKEVNLLIAGEEVTDFGGYHFNNLTKDFGVNIEYETSNILNSKDLTVILQLDDYILPVTYYVANDTDDVSYLVTKVLSINEEVANMDFTKSVSYEYNDKSLSINVTDFGDFNTNILNSIKNTMMFNFELDSILLNGIEL